MYKFIDEKFYKGSGKLKRSRKIIMVSHCILNSNSKVEGLSQYQGIFKELIDMIDEKEIGIIQLPCPEMIIYGIKRWGHVKEQFDTLFYRNNCRKMLEFIIGQVKSYIDTGYKIVGVIGIDGSPSCGVNLTCSGDWEGDSSSKDSIDHKIKNLKEIKALGIFMEELKRYLEEYNIEVPFVAINENDVYSSLNDISEFLNK
ncbi:CD3072 family TudS-related putative desulfidase [Tissierella creatinophila]|uniref:CD3072 family TudS-related putative desulfidase n=1 Tax=Tissierella creatinophila TaxID=79681 RepID=UPI001E470A6E|nr:CD3072 family TudS-related putative desulfidase [Tissierella creatinophila]